MKNLVVLFYVCIAIIAFPSKSLAQQEPLVCPTIMISGPENADLNIVKFSASVSSKPSNSALKHKWSVSIGNIISGQGTPIIEVDISGFIQNCLKVTVEIDGLQPGCSNNVSAMREVSGCCIDPRLFDRYGSISFREERMRLENLAAQLEQEPSTEARIIPTDGRRNRSGLALRRAERARAYLIKKLKIDPARVIIETRRMFQPEPQPERMVFDLYIMPIIHETPCN
ncbi:MAG: hypothetical protein AUG51_16565 [Acidobacteria bacterium 13_1_20CM_3_53_8]|nr:MAG: hypothetical protein AUG51_16565 [Acidobacteria bacterium 13_1_20CM_3_53_8]